MHAIFKERAAQNVLTKHISNSGLGGPNGKEPSCQYRRQVLSLGWEDSLEEDMATHSIILAWRISWAEEPGGVQSLGSKRVRHDWGN